MRQPKRRHNKDEIKILKGQVATLLTLAIIEAPTPNQLTSIAIILLSLSRTQNVRVQVCLFVCMFVRSCFLAYCE